MNQGMGATRQTAPLRDDYQMLEQKLARKMVGAPKPPRPPRPNRGQDGMRGRIKERKMKMPPMRTL